MAEGLLRHALATRGCTHVEVASAGTWAGDGGGPTSEAIAALKEKGVDIGSHRSRALDPKEVETADVVVAMTSVHVREILDVAPDAGSKVVLLKALAEIKGPPSDEVAERLRAWLDAPRPEWRRAMDLDDPLGLPFGAYERCVREIEAGVSALADLLCGAKDPVDPHPSG
jgi:protein-tyrosine-phosphatase